MSNQHLNPIFSTVLDSFKAANDDKSRKAQDHLYKSITLLKIYYNYADLNRLGYDVNDLVKNADALQELLITVSVFAERLDEDNHIRLAWERCVSKTVEIDKELQP